MPTPLTHGDSMEWLLMALAAGGGAGFLTKRWRERSVMRRHELEELAGVRQLADEDVTLLGEQLQRLDAEVAGRELDEPARIDYQRALDAYESAQRAVPRIRDADEISKITDTLSTGRYALTCVQARVAGRQVPEFRVPCFFNPQHGPSVTDIMWTPRGRGTRKVPACARDAARVANHERPEVRQVRIGSQAVPYWEAGAAYLPYGQGYFASGALLAGPSVMAWAFQPPVDAGGAHGAGGHDGFGGMFGGHFGGGDGADAGGGGGGDGGGGGVGP